MIRSDLRVRRIVLASGGVLAVTLLALGVAAWSVLGAQARRTQERAVKQADEAVRRVVDAIGDHAPPDADWVAFDAAWRAIDPPSPRGLDPAPLSADERALFFVDLAERSDGGDVAPARTLLRTAITSEDAAARMRAAAAGVRLELRDGTGRERTWVDAARVPTAFVGTRDGLLLGLVEGRPDAVERTLRTIGTPDEDEAIALLIGVGADGSARSAAVQRRRDRVAVAAALSPALNSAAGEAVRVALRSDGEAWVARSSAPPGVSATADAAWFGAQFDAWSVSRVADRELRETDARLVHVSDSPGEHVLRPLPGATDLAVAVPVDRDADEAWLLLVGLGIAGLVAVVAFFAFVRAMVREARVSALRTQFVATVGHELRTPVAVIRTCAETLLLGRAAREEDRRSFLEAIVRESERLAGLLGNVLDFARMEAGSKTYRFEEADLEDVVTTAVEAYRGALEHLGFTVETQFDEVLPTIRCDAEALRAAIVNLLENAAKFSPERRDVQVRVRKAGGAHSVQGMGIGTVSIDVVDHGLGVPDAEKASVFDRFVRGGSAAVQETRGTGIGLALVRGVARAHGGDVSVEDTPGGGATFRIGLPLETGSVRKGDG